jgi:hypothetical protein
MSEGEKTSLLGKSNIQGVATKRVFLDSISADSLKSNLRNISSTPHMAGTIASNTLADYFVLKFKDYLGEYATIEKVQYDVLLSYPTPQSKIQLVGGNNTVLHNAQLYEDKIIGDEYTSIDPALFPAHLAYSPNGEATAKMIYGNFCTRKDFEYLASQNINVQGTIMMCRYGKVFRGIKVQNAEKLGAAGVIIYSDPQQDGFVKGPAYPEGPFRPESGIQRGSLMYPTYSGDPTTPEYPSLPGTTNRIPRKDIINLPQKILVLPMSWKDARVFLARLDGAVAPADWQGGIPNLTYRIGSLTNSVSTSIMVHNIEKIMPVYNVVATIKGTVEPDRSVIIGNHRDAWVYGTLDPHSGSVAFLEVAKGIGAMMDKRWKPRRSLVFASWDAEEYGLIGSTEWVEHYSEILKQQVVAYLNVDTSYGTHFDVEASPALANLIRQETPNIVSPERVNTTLDQTWNNQTSYVGDGSDYAPFFHHLGIPVIAMDFRGDFMYGAYHSLYDNFNYYTKQFDGDFRVARSLAGILGLVAIRLVNDEILPFKTADQGVVLKDYANALSSLDDYVAFTSKLNPEQLATFNSMILNLNTTIQGFILVSGQFDKNVTNYSVGRNHDVDVRRMNDKQMLFERGFTRKEGIKGRPWYKHVICSPGVDLGYDFEVFPALMEAMRDNRYNDALGALEQVIAAIKTSTSFLK